MGKGTIVNIRTFDVRCGYCQQSKVMFPRWRYMHLVPEVDKFCVHCGVTRRYKVMPGPLIGEWNSKWREFLEDFQRLWSLADAEHDDVLENRIMECVVVV